jgi:divalent metal cation (Fe/Co/Zn/Cd) transporter
LVLYGLHQAKKSPDHGHPLGYGREIYFWSFVVAVMVFALGAGVSLYEGITHVLNPTPIQDTAVNLRSSVYPPCSTGQRGGLLYAILRAQ